MSALFRILARLLLTVVFMLSGVLKVQAPDRFLLDVQAFHLVPLWLAYGIALGLPWLEIFAALGLWWKGLARGAASLLGALAIGFIVFLVVAEARGLELDCGCFGDWLVFPNLATHLLFNATLAAASFWLLKKRT
jgi:hypothetical protein